VLFYTIQDWALVLLVFGIIFVPTTAGLLAGRRLHHRSESLREPVAASQAAVLGFMALILAFGLSLAVGRYQDRRAAVVNQANAIGTTYLRAQLLAEPVRSPSLALLVSYTNVSIRIADNVPGSAPFNRAVAEGDQLQRQMWSLAGQAIDAAPLASAPRLYIESLNPMIDSQSTWTSALTNRVPTAVLVLELVGAAVALTLLAFYLGLSNRGVVSVLIASSLISLVLLVTFDLDRPTRGLIRVPDTALTTLRASMALPPAAAPPKGGS
jgi:hypothetical protein